MIVPVKAFADAKARLQAVLTNDERAALARRLAEHVVEAAGELAVFVVCDDVAVAEWASRRGAAVVWSPEKGLNAAVDTAVDHVAGAGFDHLIVAHADLPLVGSLASLALPDTVVLAPDHRLDGTNVMSFPISQRVRASYGPGSFRRHLAAALALPVAVEVRRGEHTERDLDVPADLGHPRITQRRVEWAIR